MSAAHRPPSLQRRLVIWAAAGGVAALVVILLVAGLATRMRAELTASSASIREEQRIANVIVGGVMRQLVTVTIAMEGGDQGFRPAFEAAGVEVQEALQTYLFRPLSPEQRIQIAEVKEEHRRMEVGALHAAQILQLDGPAAAGEVREEVVGHALALLGTLEDFLRSREGDLERLEAGQTAAFRRLWLGGAAAVLLLGGMLMLALGRFVRARVTRPLDSLISAAGRLGEGELEARVPEPRDLEFQQLAQAFNAMAERLAGAQDALQERNEELEAALEQVRQAQEELVQSEKLGAVGRMTAGLAHELNNPLATVLGFSELLAAEVAKGAPIPAATARELLDPIVRDATRARLLIRSLLQFARRTGGEVGSADLASALQLAVNLRRDAFTQAGLLLEVEQVAGVAVVAEAQQLQSVFLNLINNAYDAMRPNRQGTLRIRVHAGPDLAEIIFEDEGPGFQDPGRAFEPFYTTKEVGQGTGLGLSLAERFVESFGGTIRALNQPGGGARLTVILRRTATTTHPAGTSPGPEALPEAGPDTTGRTVLVLEDEPYLQRLSAQLLERLGLRVLVASTATEGRALLAVHDVDLVISDVKMPGESGVSFYAWVCETRPQLAERFLFVTGDVGAQELEELAGLRPGALIHKPFAVSDYLARVRQVLEQ